MEEQQTQQATRLPRCGDIVRHRPTHESWEVAYAEGSDLAWCGWPNGRARTIDCAVVMRCTDEEHAAAVSRWLDNGGEEDSRRHAIRRLYRPAEHSAYVRRAVQGHVRQWASSVEPLAPELVAAMRRFAEGDPQ